jgi:hypothetical protein
MRLRVVIVVGLAALAAGCGSKGGGGTTSTADTSGKAAYIARADALCGQFDVGAKAVQAQLAALRGRDAATQRREAPPLIRRVAALARGLVARLRALPLPASGGAGATAVYDSGEAGAATLGQIADAIEAGDLRRAAALNARLRVATLQQRAAARAYGFRQCASGS